MKEVYCKGLGTCQLRFLSDANLVGIEKVSATAVPKAFLERPWTELPALDNYGSSS